MPSSRRILCSALIGALLLVTACSTGSSPQEPTTPAPGSATHTHPTSPHHNDQRQDSDRPDTDDDVLSREVRGGNPPAPARGLEEYADQQLDWQACEDYECAALQVPARYTEPEGDRLQLDVVRRSADGAAEGDSSQGQGEEDVAGTGTPGGVLVVHFGSGVSSPHQAVARAEQIISPEVLQHYDLVALQRRGVLSAHPSSPAADSTDSDSTDPDSADSHGIDFHGVDFHSAADQAAVPQCLDRLDPEELIAAARTHREESEEGDEAETLSCAEEDLPAVIDAYAAADDLEVLREALEEFQLHHYGRAEGSYLMALTADVYPTSVQRMVFDGGLNPSLSGAEIPVDQAAEFQRTLESFAEQCPEMTDCPAEESQQVLDLVAEAVATAGEEDTEALAIAGILAALQEPQRWAELTAALNLPAEARAAGLVDLTADALGTESADATVPADAAALRNQWSVHCLDRPLAEEQERAELPEAIWEASEVFAPWFLARERLCAALTEEASEPMPRSTEASGTGPLMVLRTTGDPLTHPGWGQRLAVHLLTGLPVVYEGEGHGAYGRDDCINALVDEYLLGGLVPAPQTTC
ncbi:alpha/beta fold hydrolase [Nesterenkonia alba]|uniref:alpha/beta fold hydrolase n=1 Tax=Nesterenkonia alba TaxID=515814 RepID=UPI000A05C9A5|nr:alpha/beta fold hydrolase [Nesterenkonia alba]